MPDSDTPFSVVRDYSFYYKELAIQHGYKN